MIARRTGSARPEPAADCDSESHRFASRNHSALRCADGDRLAISRQNSACSRYSASFFAFTAATIAPGPNCERKPAINRSACAFYGYTLLQSSRSCAAQLHWSGLNSSRYPLLACRRAGPADWGDADVQSTGGVEDACCRMPEDRGLGSCRGRGSRYRGIAGAFPSAGARSAQAGPGNRNPRGEVIEAGAQRALLRLWLRRTHRG